MSIGKIAGIVQELPCRFTEVNQVDRWCGLGLEDISLLMNTGQSHDLGSEWERGFLDLIQ